MHKENLRKSIQVRFDPMGYRGGLEKFMREYAELVNYGITFTYNVYQQYEKVEVFEGVCSVCGKDKNLTHRHKKTGALLCMPCFRRAYGEFTLRSSLIPVLQENFPEFSVYSTMYYSTLRHIFGTFKSWVRKQEQRERDRAEILRNFKDVPESGEGKSSVSHKSGNPKDKDYLQHNWQQSYKIKKLKKDINIPIFRGSTLRYWKGFAGLCDNLLGIWLKNPKIEKVVGDYPLMWGDYQEKHIKEVIEELGHKYMSVHKKGNKFFLDVPYTKTVELMDDGDMLNSASKKDANIVVVVFGIREPATVSVYQNNEMINRKTFGNSTLYEKKQRFREIDAKAMKKISKRHDKKKAKTQKQKWFKKTRNRRRNFIKDYDNRLTYHIAKYIQDIPNPIVIMRNNTKIKNIGYKGVLKKTLMDWSIIQQQKMLEHKLNFLSISVYWMPYRKINELLCPKCGEGLGKTLTQKLKLDNQVKCACGFTEDIYALDTNNIIDSFYSHLSKKNDKGFGSNPSR